VVSKDYLAMNCLRVMAARFPLMWLKLRQGCINIWRINGTKQKQINHHMDGHQSQITGNGIWGAASLIEADHPFDDRISPIL
jgi:hypothetical protein